MVLAILITITVLILGIDCLAYRRWIRKSPLWLRIIFFALTIATTLAPFAWVGISFVVFKDNAVDAINEVSGWLMWVFMISVFPRWTFYLFAFIGRNRAFYFLATIAAATVIALFVKGTVYDRNHLIVNDVTIHSERLPRAFEGYRIAQFSDVHLAFCSEALLREVISTINAANVDLVVFSGDLVNLRHTELSEQRMALLASLRARNGVVAVIGNHDCGFYVRDTVALPVAKNLATMIEKERSMGWRVLTDSTIYIQKDKDSISLTGIGFPCSGDKTTHTRSIEGVDYEAAYRNVPSERFNITISHIPQNWAEIRAQGRGDVTLSGHVHAMQMKFRVAGVTLSPAQLLYRQWSGLYERDGRYLYINDGIGCAGYPMRVGAYPEVTIIELKR